MIPQLWIRNLEWLEWRQMHPDLDDREAEYLYQVEQKMFQNYQDEIRNQMLNRQTRLVGDLMNLSADISTVLNQGGVYEFKYTADYDGYININDELGFSGSFSGTGTFNYTQGDIFVYNENAISPNLNGLWRVNTTITLGQAPTAILAYINIFVPGISAGYWTRVAELDGTPL